MLTDRLILLAPALLATGFMLLAFVLYAVRCALGRPPAVTALKHNEFFGPYVARYILWLIGPVERVLLGRVSANAITWASLLLCAGAGVAAATGSLATACWLYVLAGVLDLLDGRLARASGTQSPAGALFDSVADRWGELAVFAGFAWYLRATPWLLAVMLAVAGSMMVSYTRARGEGLGLALRGGVMQRAERIVLVSAGALVGAWFAAAADTSHHAATALGGALLATGAASTFTALGRWLEGYRALAAQERAAATATVTVASDKAPIDKLGADKLGADKQAGREPAPVVAVAASPRRTTGAPSTPASPGVA